MIVTYLINRVSILYVKPRLIIFQNIPQLDLIPGASRPVDAHIPNYWDPFQFNFTSTSAKFSLLWTPWD